MSKQHLLSIEDLQGFESSTIIASQCGSVRNKQIILESFLNEDGQIKSRISVYSDKSLKLQTLFLIKAIEEYNKY